MTDGAVARHSQDADVQKQIMLYYLYIALIGTWFTSGVTLFFGRKFLTDTQIGLMDALALGVGLLAEIPSGTIADRFGRRRTVMIGVGLSGFGFALWGVSLSGWMVFTGVLLFALGTALQSGADEAMMYDYLKAHGSEHRWPRINAMGGVIARLSYVVSIFVGGIAYISSDRLPFLLRALTFFVMIVPLVKLAVIDRFQDTDQHARKHRRFMLDFKNGIKEIFNANVVWLVPLFMMAQGVSYTVFTAGILRPLLYEKAGLAVEYHSFAIAISLVLTVVALFAISRNEKNAAKKRVIYSLALVCALGFGLNIGHVSLAISLLGLTIIQIAAYSLMPILSTALNTAISSRYRATTLSTANFMQSIVYVVAAPVIGFLSFQGYINEVAIAATAIVMMGILVSLTFVLIFNRSSNRPRSLS